MVENAEGIVDSNAFWRWVIPMECPCVAELAPDVRFLEVDSPDGERWRGPTEPHGRSIRVQVERASHMDWDPMPDVGPCGRLKDHERKQPDRTPAGGGYGWKYAKAHNERAKVESGSQTTDYQLWNHTLKVIITP